MKEKLIDMGFMLNDSFEHLGVVRYLLKKEYKANAIIALVKNDTITKVILYDDFVNPLEQKKGIFNLESIEMIDFILSNK